MRDKIDLCVEASMSWMIKNWGHAKMSQCLRPTFEQGILKGEVSLYRWPPIRLVGNQLYDTWQFFFFIYKTDWSKPVKQEVNGTVILPPLAFPGSWLLLTCNYRSLSANFSAVYLVTELTFIRAQGYKTFYVCNLLMLIKSKSVCHWQTSPS